MCTTTAKRWAGWIVLVLGISFVGCGGCSDETTPANNSQTDMGPDTGEAPPFTWAVDESIQPHSDSLHAMEVGGDVRPLSAVGGDDAPTASFVQNELVMFSNDLEAVEDFVARVNGELVLTEDPAVSGVGGPMMHLVRLDAPAMDPEQFVADLAALEELDDEGYELTGDFMFSDEKGAQLIALAARESVENGLDIGVNWVGQPSAIPESTEEALNTQTMQYRDAYDFSWFARDTGMKTGVTDAWDLLYHAGRLDNRIKLAVLDMGFKATADLENISSTTVWPGFGPMNQENIIGCSGGNPCPWHGTDVSGAAMGLPDNQFGAAGSGGPVTEPILVYTTYDYLAGITAVYRARSRGAKIINMSYSAGVPWWLKWTVAGFRHATSAVADSGLLLFAAAGNEGTNVDREICLFGHCWEKTFHTPCENAGVICVGGLSGPNEPDDDSNWGDGSVDLWGPWCVDVGNNPGNDAYHQSCGTSLASPFVAGVAALVWAANPSRSASDVKTILYDTADGHLSKKVNAYEGVLTAIGSLMDVRIIDPADGAERWVGIPAPVAVDTQFISQPGPAIDVHLTLTSSVDGEIGQQDITVSRTSGDVHTERAFFVHDFSEGLHELVVVAEWSRGDDWWSLPPIIVTDRSTFLLSNPRPSVTVESPLQGETFCSGETVVFRATAQDLNQSIPDSAYSWLTAIDANPYPILLVLGEGPVLSTSVLPIGQQRVTASVTDDGGQISNASVDIEVISTSNPLCSDRPPQVVINSPTDGISMMATGVDANGTYADINLQATVSDFEDDDGTLVVDWTSDLDGPIGSGTSTTGRIYMTPGSCSTTHMIRAHTVDSDGNPDDDSVTVSIYIVC